MSGIFTKGPVPGQHPHTPPLAQGWDANPFRTLTVSEIVALAGAGVKMEFKDIADRVRSDDPPPQQATSSRDRFYSPYADAIFERWLMSQKATRDFNEFEQFPFHLSAASHGDQIYVFVRCGQAEPVIITDDAAIFPSDALMAKLHLMREAAPGAKDYANPPSQQSSAAIQGSATRVRR